MKQIKISYKTIEDFYLYKCKIIYSNKVIRVVVKMKNLSKVNSKNHLNFNNNLNK